MSTYIGTPRWMQDVDRRADAPLWYPTRRSGMHGGALLGPTYGDHYPVVTASHAWYFITGVTRDATGTPLGGVTVQAFRTSDDAYISQVVSEPDGTYSVGVDSTAEHYVVGFIAGAPNRAGGSDNTLVGT